MPTHAVRSSCGGLAPVGIAQEPLVGFGEVFRQVTRALVTDHHLAYLAELVWGRFLYDLCLLVLIESLRNHLIRSGGGQLGM